MNVVARRNTPISESEAERVVSDAYRETFGAAPRKRVLVALLSLVWIETARGRSVQNHNLGNITASERWPGDAWRPPWFEPGPSASERDLKLHQEMLAGRAPRAFRAYPNAITGARDYVRTLKGSFPEVLAAAETGDSEDFRNALAIKYSKDYAHPRSAPTFATLFQEWNGKIQGGADEPRGVTPLFLALGVVAVAGAIFYLTINVKPAPSRGKAVAA